MTAENIHDNVRIRFGKPDRIYIHRGIAPESEVQKMDKRHKTTAEIGSKTPESTTPAEASVTAEDVTSTAATPTAGNIPAEYLRGGYYVGEGKGRYPDPVLVDQAEEIGKSLAAGGVTATAFNRLLRTLKTAKNKPFEAQAGALKKIVPQVLDLERKKKAPPLLREIVERNRAAVKDKDDFAACLDHFQDIGIFLAMQAAAEGTP